MGWTDERVVLLKRLWVEGKTAAEIAKLIGGGVTRNAVIGKAHRLKLSGRISPIQENTRGGIGGEAGGSRSVSTPRKSQKATIAKVSNREIIAPVQLPPVQENYCFGDGVSLVDLKERMCRWPIGDPKESGFKFCGGPSDEGIPYCNHHARVAYQINTKSKLRIEELSKIDADVIRKKIAG
ncbi:MAG TPA: gcrA cell cycle regulator family protein [Rhodospirillaceae bacterium]|nr:gcrA cell cycle regulator family protein [Rhodospirillaceae bacterium]